METAAAVREVKTLEEISLSSLPVGARIIVQTKKDWRMAVISSNSGENIILRVCSPSGGTYRKKCAAETILFFDGAFHLMGDGIWREQFVKYDCRW